MQSGDQQSDACRHLGYLLPHAIWQFWPNVKFGLYQITEQGFCYDVDTGDESISEKDFSRIEDKISQALRKGISLDYQTKPIHEVLDWARGSHQSYLLDYFEDLKDQNGEVCFASSDGFVLPIIDIDPVACRELENSTPENLHFKIIKIGGAYWKSQADQPQLQRLQVVVFATAKELEEHSRQAIQQIDTDHRQIAKEHDLFMFSDLVGSGLPLFQENGAIIRRELENFIIDETVRRGYANVYTPDITQVGLYEVSGHYPYYKDTMYSPIEIDGKEFMLRPMTCPHHFQIYNQRIRSFRELPIRFTEMGKLYRYEKSGELSGLTRVRSFTLSDAHIICRPDQVEAELGSALQLIEDMAAVFGFKPQEHYSYRLSLGKKSDEKKYFKGDQAWDKAAESLRSILKVRGYQFVEAEDEAAFYGPKIDMQIRNQAGKEETLFTVQYDFVMPGRFGLTYMDGDNQAREAVVIHHSIIGSIERFMAFLIEFYKGKFPVWLSPCQLKILTVNTEEKLLNYVYDLKKQALNQGVRVKIDDSQNSIGKKIHQSQLDFVPYILVIGDKELKRQEFEVKLRSNLQNSGLKNDQFYSFDEILTTIVSHIDNKS